MIEAAPAEDKKREIVELAFERFYEGGFRATGVDTVMADSGISKRTLYKYFASKEALIEAVLDHYGARIATELFAPVMAASDDPRQQLVAFFAIRKAMIDAHRTRGCLGMKAAQEYAGMHEGIAGRGTRAVLNVERQFVELCRRARLPRPADLGRKINILFQGALLLSQVLGDSSPFVAAEASLLTLLESAGDAGRDGKLKKKHGLR